MHLLIVDDNAEHLFAIKNIFERQKDVSSIHTAQNYKAACDKIKEHHFDIAILDIELKEAHTGIDICSLIAPLQTLPIMLTGYDSLMFMEQSYEAGCCDYLRKPLRHKEVLLKVKKWWQLAQSKHLTNADLEYHHLKYQFVGHKFIWKGEDLILSPKAKRLFFLLLTNAESTVTRRQIEQYLWGDHYSSMKKRNIGESIGELKKQLPEELQRWVLNVRGEGYVLNQTD